MPDPNIKRFMSLFRGFEQRHGRFEIDRDQSSGKMVGHANTVDKEPTLEDYANHLDGATGIGIIPLTGSNKVYFAAIDIDDYSMDPVDIAWKVKDLPVFVTRSKSNGTHVWLFIPNGARADLVISTLKSWAGELGYGGCEIFPKQSSRASKEDIGNWINLPYFGKTRQCIAVLNSEDKSWKELGLAEFLDFAEAGSKGVTESWLHDIGGQIKRQRDVSTSKVDYVDGPICMERLKEKGLIEGGRNIFFANLAVYFMRKYGSGDIAKLKCSELNEAQDHPLGKNELERTVKSVTKKEYGYQCQSHPLKGYCDRTKCLKRRFGVGSNSLDLPFEMGGFTMILTEPPMFAFNANGFRITVSCIADLLNQRKFRELIAERIRKIPPMMSQPKYDQLVQSWLDQAEEVTPPPDTDSRLMWVDELKSFIATRKHSIRDKLLAGRVWIDPDNPDVAHFQMKDFKKFLKTNNVEYDGRTLYQYLRMKVALEYNKQGTTVKEQSVRLYSIDIRNLQLVSEMDASVNITDVM